MRRMFLACAMIFAMAPVALACSEDELQAKSINLAELVKAIVAKNPDQAQAWRSKQVAVDQVAEVTTDLDRICSAYDQAIAEAKAAQ